MPPPKAADANGPDARVSLSRPRGHGTGPHTDRPTPSRTAGPSLRFDRQAFTVKVAVRKRALACPHRGPTKTCGPESGMCALGKSDLACGGVSVDFCVRCVQTSPELSESQVKGTSA
jgi:hypothetical protein